MDVSSLKITLPQSKSLQPVATVCSSVKPSLDAALQQWLFVSLKRFITVRKLPGKLVAALWAYPVRRAERVLFINSADSCVLFPSRTTRAPCRIAPMTLPIILEFKSPILCKPHWNVIPSTSLRSWKTIFNKSDNTLSQISPVRHDIKEWMPTSQELLQ